MCIRDRFSSQDHPSVRQAPLDMIEGVSSYDCLRLEELGIDSCYDLATTDFVPLVLKTPYSARKLLDWILQAKLCACFGDHVKDLRENGIRTIVDLKGLDEHEIAAIASETTLTRSSMLHAQRSIRCDMEVQRLQDIANKLGRFTPDPPPERMSEAAPQAAPYGAVNRRRESERAAAD